MRTSMSRISMGSHGVIVTDWSLDMRCAFQAGSPNACSVILLVCLQRLRAAKAASIFFEGFSVLGRAFMVQGRARFAAGSP